MIQNKKDYYRFLDEEKSHISYISAIFGGDCPKTIAT